MSKDDLKVVRRSSDSHAWERADWDILKDLYDEDVVFHSSIVDIVGKTVVGHEALRRFITEIQEECTALRWEEEVGPPCMETRTSGRYCACDVAGEH